MLTLHPKPTLPVSLFLPLPLNVHLHALPLHFLSLSDRQTEFRAERERALLRSFIRRSGHKRVEVRASHHFFSSSISIYLTGVFALFFLLFIIFTRSNTPFFFSFLECALNLFLTQNGPDHQSDSINLGSVAGFCFLLALSCA